MRAEISLLGGSAAHLYCLAIRKALPASNDALTRSVQRMGGVMSSLAREAEIYGEKEPGQYFYKVIGGCVRTYKMLIDGRRQITAFYLPDDIFGLESGDEYVSSAEATIDARVLVIKRSVVVSIAERDCEMANQLWMLTNRELQRARLHALLLVKSAPERVASFLLEMAARIQSGDEVELPMSRQDIADHLGLTIETVSRMLSQFEQTSAIALPTCRRVALRRRAVLERLVA
jgi:CRP/FNR family nitrogen fixation transcriptional regulator